MCIRDSRNRTAADVRHYFDKFGSGLGQTGCVSFLFEQKGVLILEDEDCLLYTSCYRFLGILLLVLN